MSKVYLFMYKYSVSSHEWGQCIFTCVGIIFMCDYNISSYSFRYSCLYLVCFHLLFYYLPWFYSELIFNYFSVCSVSEWDEEKETHAEFPSFLDHEGRHGFSKVRSSNRRIMRRVRLYSVLLEMLRTSSPQWRASSKDPEHWQVSN